MISLTPALNDTLPTPLYMQLYQYIREAILSGHIVYGDKLPSLRALSRTLGLSLTTVELAYNQLAVEGYIHSRPQSGFYVNHVSRESPAAPAHEDRPAEDLASVESEPGKGGALYYDPACFDFNKWKKCANRVLTDYSHLLFVEGDPRGEASLRREVSRYIYQARGVLCTPDQVVIGAGTQQLMSLLCIILVRMGIDHVSFEDPGYQPVRSIFKDRGFKMTGVPVDRDGLNIRRLPVNIKSTVYVSPSNQFPTGSVMPIGRRYALLEWAYQNGSIIIEDDYNSELRYFSRPVPSLQGLDTKGQVVYLGSFSSTLFPAIKISYMVLPPPMGRLFEEVLADYTQTCSKAEQLTLALYMEQGYYQTNQRKLRTLYAQKIQLATQALSRYGENRFHILNNSSGLHMLLEVHGLPQGLSAEDFCQEARDKGLPIFPVAGYPKEREAPAVLFYYTRIPADKMDEAVKSLAICLHND